MVKEQNNLISEEEQARLEMITAFFDFVGECLKNPSLNPGHKLKAKTDPQGARIAECRTAISVIIIRQNLKKIDLSDSEKNKLKQMIVDYGIKLGLSQDDVLSLLDKKL